MYRPGSGVIIVVYLPYILRVSSGTMYRHSSGVIIVLYLPVYCELVVVRMYVGLCIYRPMHTTTMRIYVYLY
jgi:hypothetical protein